MSIEHREPKINLSRTTIFAEGSYPSLDTFGYNSSIHLIADRKPVMEIGRGGAQIITLFWEQDELRLEIMIVFDNGALETYKLGFRLSEDGHSIIANERIGDTSNGIENVAAYVLSFLCSGFEGKKIRHFACDLVLCIWLFGLQSESKAPSRDLFCGGKLTPPIIR
jgi:hypothetical protein